MKNQKPFAYLKLLFLIYSLINCALSLTPNTSALISDQSISVSLNTPTEAIPLLSRENGRIDNKNDTIFVNDSSDDNISQTYDSSTAITTPVPEIEDKFIDSENSSSIANDESLVSREAKKSGSHLSDETTGINTTGDSIRLRDDLSRNSSQILLSDTTNTNALNDSPVILTLNTSVEALEKFENENLLIIGSTVLDNNTDISNAEPITSGLLNTTTVTPTGVSIQDINSDISYGSDSEINRQNISLISPQQNSETDSNAVTETEPKTTTQFITQTTVETDSELMLQTNAETKAPVISPIDPQSRAVKDTETNSEVMSLTSLPTTPPTVSESNTELNSKPSIETTAQTSPETISNTIPTTSPLISVGVTTEPNPGVISNIDPQISTNTEFMTQTIHYSSPQSITEMIDEMNSKPSNESISDTTISRIMSETISKIIATSSPQSDNRINAKRSGETIAQTIPIETHTPDPQQPTSPTTSERHSEISNETVIPKAITTSNSQISTIETTPGMTSETNSQISSQRISLTNTRTSAQSIGLNRNIDLTNDTLNNEKVIDETLVSTAETTQTPQTVTNLADAVVEAVGAVDQNSGTNASTIGVAVSERPVSETTTSFGELIHHSMQSLRNKTINDTIASETPMTSTDSNRTGVESLALSPFKVMCTVGNWATYRRGFGKFDVQDLERADFVLSRCSHLVYSFASLATTGRVSTFDSVHELNPKTGTFAKLRAIKARHPHIKTLIAVGGWDTPANVFTFLTADKTRRQSVAQRVTDFVKHHSFDGAVISWFFPGAQWAGGHKDDKTNLVSFLEDLKLKMKSNNLELGIMAPALQEEIDAGFDVPNVSNLVDHLLIMSYDYFGSWDQTVNHLAPLYANNNHSSNLNVNFTVNYWLSKGAIREKIVLGLATYGRTFTLADPNSNKINASAIGPGIPGPYTNRPGIMGFNEICEIFLSTAGVKLEEDGHKVTPYIHLYDQWVGFEDELSLFMKTMYAMDNELEGVFFWTLDLDDFQNKCGWGHFPLLKATIQAIYKTKEIR